MIYQKPDPSAPQRKAKRATTILLTFVFGSMIVVPAWTIYSWGKEAEAKELERESAHLRQEEARRARDSASKQDELRSAAIYKGEEWCYALITAEAKIAVDWVSGARETGAYNDNGESLQIWMKKKGTAMIAGTKVNVTGYAKVQCWRQPKKGEEIVCLPLEQWVR